jgi:signal transduction histidine kinase/CheY-like chemotaxis protein
MMILNLHFRKKYILREQINIVNNNFTIGVLTFFLITVVAGLILHFATNTKGILYWLAASAFITLLIFSRYYWHKKYRISTLANAHWLVASQMLLGSLWGFLAFFIDGSYSNILIIMALSAGVCSGGMDMQAPCLPIFIGFLVSATAPIVMMIFVSGGLAGISLGGASLLYLVAVISFAKRHESWIATSLELRYKNDNLICELKQTMFELQEANQTKSMFLASASHDLRQPLHAIGLFIETLKYTELDEQQQTLVNHINTAAQGTRELLNALLDYSKLNAGAITPVIKNFNMQPLLTKLERELSPNATVKNLVYRCRETLLAVETDKVLLELILRNIISNAINYTESGGVLIGCRKHNKTVAIEVWDTGIGIAKNDLDNIFKEFLQLYNSERNREKGFGLGLAIVDGLTKKLGLDIDVLSTEGKGTVFRLTVPLCESRIIEEAVVVDEITCNFDGLQVLLIDDDESIRIGMGGLLESWGINCHIAESSADAINMVFENNFIPDLIISDYRLRDNLTGRQALDDIRGTTFDAIPAIIITGDTDPVRFKDASEANAILLHKPIAAPLLRSTISNLLC